MSKVPSARQKSSSNTPVALWLLAVVVIAIVPYVASLTGSFTLDDWALIVKDPLAHSLSNASWAFHTDFLHGNLGAPYPMYYRPLITVSFQLDYAIAGLNPLYFRCVNLMLHLAVVLLVFALIRHITKDVRAAGIGAIAFAVLPSHAESVAWVSGRTDLISTLFLLAAFLVFIKTYDSINGFRWSSAGLCSILLGAALFSKESGAMAILLMLVYAWMFGAPEARRTWWKWAIALLPMVIFYAICRQHVVGNAMERFVLLNIGRRILGVGIAYAAYLRMLFLPLEPRVIYDVFPIGMKYPILSVAAWMAPTGLVVLAVWGRRRSRTPAFVAAWLFLALLPVSNILPTIGPLPAERFVYFASIGSSLLLGWAAVKALQWRPRAMPDWPRTFATIGCMLVVYCGIMSVQGAQHYSSDVAWAREIASSRSRFAVMHLIAGGNLAQAGFLAEGVKEMELAQSLGGDSVFEASDLILMAIVERKLGHPDKCLRILESAKARFGGSAKIEYHIGVVLAETGRLQEARLAFERSTRMQPSLGPPWRNLGKVNLKLGNFQESVRAYEKAFGLTEPTLGDHFELGMAYEGARMSAKAIKELQIVVDQDPNGQLGARAAQEIRRIRS